MNLKLEIEFSKAEILQEVDALKKQINDMRPLPEDVEGRVMQKLRLDWNYHSNAIEGNKLSYGETIAFLMEGITAKGKPLKDHLDIRGHNEAIIFLLSIVKDTRPISEADIRNLHQMILVEPYEVKAQTAEGLPTTKRITLGEYKTMPNHVKTATGEIHYYATPEETPAKMQELMEWYSEMSNSSEIHPVVTAALFHHKFVSIHPFDDGNGRLSRILMNLILMQKGFPPIVIKMDDRQNYYSLLSRADNGDNWPFIEYIAEGLFSSLRLFLKAAMGGDIEEDEDINKEIALFKKEVQFSMASKKEISPQKLYDLCIEEILPLIREIVEKASTFDEFFFKKENRIEIDYTNLITDNLTVFPIIIDRQDITQTFKFFSNHVYKINQIGLNLGLMKFKEERNTFDIDELLIFGFDLYEYRISNDKQNLELMRPYGVMLNKEDKKRVIAITLRNIKDAIQSKLKPKSPKP